MAEAVSTPRVTGVDIPEELFEHILWHTTYVHISLFGSDTPSIPPSRDPSVRILTSLIQVCKHFASICRPWLYRELLLRNRRQLRGLLDLLNSGHGPLGANLLVFTDSLRIKTEEDDTLWVHQIATVLIPGIQHAGLKPIERVELVVDRPLPGLVPNRSSLPRTIPASLLLNITSLRLDGTHFPRGEDLLRCLSSFGDLRCVTLRACTCGTIAAPPALARFPVYSSAFDVEVDDDACFATVLPAVLDAHARYRDIPYLTREQEEFQVLVEAVALLCDRFVEPTAPKRFGIITQSLLAVHWKVEDPKSDHTSTSVVDRGAEDRLILFIHLIDETRYNVVFHVSHLPTREGSVNATRLIDVWRQLAGCMARLERLHMLQVQFRAKEVMEIFLEAIRSVLEANPAAGRNAEFGVEEKDKKTRWETADSILRRIKENEAMGADGQDDGLPNRLEGTSS